MPLSSPFAGTPELPILSSADCLELVQATQYQGAAVAASSVWPTAGLACFVPIRLSQRRTYVRAWWLNGTAVSGNSCLGVYTISGTTGTQLQTTGAQLQAGLSTMQTFTISWTLDPGMYYLAFSHSDGVGTYFRPTVSALAGRVSGCYQATTQSPLAASPTVAVYSTASCIPYFGLAEQSVV